MKVAEVRERAKQMSVPRAAGRRKGELIRAIQEREHNPTCFGSAGRFECRQHDCCWRTDCLTPNPG